MRGHILLALFAFSLPTSVLLAQQAGCKVELIKALRTRYNADSSSTLAQLVRHAACEGSSTGVTGKYSSYSLDYQQRKQACQNDQSDYFEKHAETIAMSYLPPDAFSTIKQLCGGDNHLSLDIDSSGQALSITAKYNPFQGGPQFATITEVNFDPSVLQCDLKDIKANPRLQQGGRVIQCKKLKDDGTVISMNTNRGSQSTILHSEK